MARIGVTYLDIANAAEAIKTQGQEPTVDRVREHLGTGSKSTIAPHLKHWKNKNSDLVDNNGLPSNLLKVVKSLHDRIHDSASNKIKQAQNTFNTEIEALKQKYNEAKKVINGLSSQKNTLEHDLRKAESHNQSLLQSNSDLKTSVEKTSFEHQQAQSHINELKLTIQELKQENKDIRDHFEHYQQHIAEDRQLEREQFQLTIDQLQGQNTDLLLRNSKQEKSLTELIDKKQAGQVTIDSLQAENQRLQLTEKGQQSEMKRLSEQVITREEQYQQANNDQKKIRGDLDTLSTQQAKTEQELQLLKQSLKQTKEELLAAKDKITIKDNEYKILLQEKSVIQGQFKQLQSSL